MSLKGIFAGLVVLVLCGPGWPPTWMLHKINNLYLVYWKHNRARPIRAELALVAAFMTLLITFSGCLHLALIGYTHLALSWAYTYVLAFVGFLAMGD